MDVGIPHVAPKVITIPDKFASAIYRVPNLNFAYYSTAYERNIHLLWIM